ncbi:hypothetical protein ACKXGF_08215 [Alkalibacillus sp. S2W]|uniref:hypothetical protein n=1 Tax=Alkalibacillus sp. S2W TaxID=3386553 RepID=UPI00398CE070
MKMTSIIMAMLLMLPTGVSDSEKSEWVFTSTGAGDTVLLQTEDTLALINTGNPQEFEELNESIELTNHDTIKSIVMTSSEANSCNNLTQLIDKYEVQYVYMVPTFDDECLDENENVDDITLQQESTFTLSRRLYIQYRTLEHDQGNVFISNGATSMYWYESSDDYDITHADVAYFPSYLEKEDVDLKTLYKIEPEVAIINENNDIQPNSSIYQHLQELWVDTYLLSDELAIHVLNEDRDFSVKLDKLQQK